MAGSKAQPIIFIKKKGGHGGHHGGAWKVADADFVTAMVSLFIVLWLMNSSEKIKKAVAGYFNDPRGTSTLMGTTLTGTGETVTAATSDNMQTEGKARAGDQSAQRSGEAPEADRDHHHSGGAAHRVARGQERDFLSERERVSELEWAGVASTAGLGTEDTSQQSAD